MAIGAGARRIARVVGVDEVDPPDDRLDPVDRVGQVLAGGMGVAGVEAESDGDVGLGRRHRIPEQRERVEPARDGVVAARRVLEVHGHVGVQHLERPRPAAHAGLDAVLGVAGMDDDRHRTDRGSRFACLLEDLARSVADVALRRADIDQVRGVDVDRDVGVAQLVCVGPRGRPLPALRIGQEDLDAVGSERRGGLERALRFDVGADLGLRRCHRGRG